MDEVFECQLYTEIKPRLNTIHIFVQPQHRINREARAGRFRNQHPFQWPFSRVPSKVTVGKGQIEVDMSNFSHIFKLHKIQVVPSSCHGLSFADGTLQFTLHLEPADNFMENEMDLQTTDNGTKIQSKLKEKAVSMACKACGMTFMVNQSFSRVLPMPDDGWADMTDSWYCHIHQGEQDKVSTPSLQPCDCLFNANNIAMNGQKLVTEALIVANNCVKCKRCHSPLGRTVGKSDNDKLQQNSVILSSDNILFNHEKCSPESLPPEYFANYLLEECHRCETFRVVIETRRPGDQKVTPILLLWIFDTNCWIAESATNSNKDTYCHLEPSPVVKILYKDCLEKRNSEFWKSWNHDMTIHSIELQYSASLRLVQLLASSTARLPSFLRSLNKFCVGHLPR